MHKGMATISIVCSTLTLNMAFTFGDQVQGMWAGVVLADIGLLSLLAAIWMDE